MKSWLLLLVSGITCNVIGIGFRLREQDALAYLFVILGIMLVIGASITHWRSTTDKDESPPSN